MELGFAGVAEPVVFSESDAAQLRIDDFRLGAMPEPSTWAMTLAGFAAFRARRPAFSIA